MDMAGKTWLGMQEDTIVAQCTAQPRGEHDGLLCGDAVLRLCSFPPEAEQDSFQISGGFFPRASRPVGTGSKNLKRARAYGSGPQCFSTICRPLLTEEKVLSSAELQHDLNIGSFSSAAKMHLARKQIFPVLVPSRWLTETARDQTVMETVTVSFCSCVAAEKQMQGANLLRRGTHGATTTPMVPLLKGSLYESLAQAQSAEPADALQEEDVYISGDRRVLKAQGHSFST
ncbi:hypothetical protein Anapl_17659 [Anas platyrhynchos]|uniref:Uncharacterized protein n=1 Tax=Anas platyrhynchos TaxID=8839 RepID=R0LJG8_ANAPL|nr:hypothetical protein Anapl_17659 [Anas platyrhynchos]